MHFYNMVWTPEYFGSVKRGAFDHWKGETVPLRGPNREIIGEATVKDVDHREDGNVYITVESTIDPSLTDSCRALADVLRGRQGMSFSIPHQPRRDDDVARWLKNLRDNYGPLQGRQWRVLDGVLDEYRARADYGLTLDDDLSQLPDGY